MNASFPMSTLNTTTNNTLRLEEIALTSIAEQYGTPTYVYSRAALTQAFKAWQTALTRQRSFLCYAVKANSNLGILSLFARLGTGFDIVSGGELARVLAAGGSPDKVVFSGVGKTSAEIRFALQAGLRCFNVESASELLKLNTIASELNITAPIALRVNPDVDPKTHPYISTGLKSNKFGIPFSDARTLYRQAKGLSHIHISGIACHIGSQLLDPAPITEAAEKILILVNQLNSDGITLDHIDLGGGLGIRYSDENAPSVTDYLAPILHLFAGRPEELCFEPGRSLVGNAGLLLTRIEYLKAGEEKNFAIVDAAMNDLARPVLYDAYHEVIAVTPHHGTPQCYEIVGPICESADFLAHDRSLALREGDLLALLSTGAYGMTMSSNYNSRPRAAEVMVDGNTIHLIRERETIESLYALEHPLN